FTGSVSSPGLRDLRDESPGTRLREYLTAAVISTVKVSGGEAGRWTDGLGDLDKSCFIRTRLRLRFDPNQE
ncbi:MAG: hypothetical protein MN733_32825, partial [Nitrososphaera sp.]|nr:hypothetical protein [Nitrososphaera sp.]